MAKIMAKKKTGAHASRKPWLEKPSSPEPCPSWKISWASPNAAGRRQQADHGAEEGDQWRLQCEQQQEEPEHQDTPMTSGVERSSRPSGRRSRPRHLRSAPSPASTERSRSWMLRECGIVGPDGSGSPGGDGSRTAVRGGHRRENAGDVAVAAQCVDGPARVLSLSTTTWSMPGAPGPNASATSWYPSLAEESSGST